MGERALSQTKRSGLAVRKRTLHRDYQLTIEDASPKPRAHLNRSGLSTEMMLEISVFPYFPSVALCSWFLSARALVDQQETETCDPLDYRVRPLALLIPEAWL